MPTDTELKFVSNRMYKDAKTIAKGRSVNFNDHFYIARPWASGIVQQAAIRLTKKRSALKYWLIGGALAGLFTFSQAKNIQQQWHYALVDVKAAKQAELMKQQGIKSWQFWKPKSQASLGVADVPEIIRLAAKNLWRNPVSVPKHLVTPTGAKHAAEAGLAGAAAATAYSLTGKRRKTKKFIRKGIIRQTGPVYRPRHR